MEMSGLTSMINQKCVVRTYSAGVWYGEIIEKDGNEVIIKNARRLWRWHTPRSISLSGVALYGLLHNKSMVPPPVDTVWVEAIELIPATREAILSIEAAPHAEAN